MNQATPFQMKLESDLMEEKSPIIKDSIAYNFGNQSFVLSIEDAEKFVKIERTNVVQYYADADTVLADVLAVVVELANPTTTDVVDLHETLRKMLRGLASAGVDIPLSLGAAELKMFNGFFDPVYLEKETE